MTRYTTEEMVAINEYANHVAAELFRKHGRLLQMRAASHKDPHHALGLIDAAELAEATATNLESIK